MDRAELTALVAAFFREQYGLEDLAGDEPLFATGLVDSMALVIMISRFEDRLGIRFRTDDITVDSFGTINRIVAGLAAKLDGR